MYPFRIVYVLEIAPLPADEHIRIDQGRNSLTQYDVLRVRPGTTKPKNCRYRLAGGVRYFRPDWAFVRNTRSGSRDAAYRLRL